MKRIITLLSLFIALSGLCVQAEDAATPPPSTSLAQEHRSTDISQKEYLLVPDASSPAVDEYSYSPRDEAWILRSNQTQRIDDLLKALIIVGILLTVLCIFMVTGSSDVRWEKEENAHSR